MSNILIVQDEKLLDKGLVSLLEDIGHDIIVVSDETEIFKAASLYLPDIALIDIDNIAKNKTNICQKLKLQNETSDLQIICLASKDCYSSEMLVGADGYVAKPFDNNILIATINAHLRIKKLLDILYTNNNELAKSLYQLNVLFNISSQLAGTLNKAKLINIMNTGLEKSLNFSLCFALILNGPEDASLIINSVYPISERLEHALKIRAVVGYKNYFEGKKLPFELSIDNVSIEKHHKTEDKKLDLNVLEYDYLFSSINTSDKFFGTVEILRDVEFTGEDSTCFHTVVKQVAMPLESAILYEEITKTNAKLEKLEKLKSEFISIVSHELRTPLTSMKNSLDIMLSGKTGEINKNQSKFLSMASRNVKRLSRIINDLLDLSKIEAGKMEYLFEESNIEEVIDFAKSTFESLAEEKNINMSVKSDNSLPKIYADTGKIEQILSNLVSNAIKFTPENGQVCIFAEVINFKNLKKDIFKFQDMKFDKLLKDDYIKITIEDTGVGIKEKDIPKIFDKFHQIESSLSRKVGGTGLGLPIVKQLIEAHRGIIWTQSEINKGSKFSFILPIASSNNKFLLELDNELKYSKYNHTNFVLINIFNISDRLGLNIENLKENLTDIFEKDKKIKIFTDKNDIKLIIKNVIKLDINKTIEILKKHLENDNYEMGIAVYPEDGITSEELLDFTKEPLIGLS